MGNANLETELIDVFHAHQVHGLEEKSVTQKNNSELDRSSKFKLKSGLNSFEIFFDRPEKLLEIHIFSNGPAVCKILDSKKETLGTITLNKGANIFKVERFCISISVFIECEAFEPIETHFGFEVEKDFLARQFKILNSNGTLFEASELSSAQTPSSFLSDYFLDGRILNILDRLPPKKQSELLFPTNVTVEHNLIGEPIKKGVCMFVHLMNRNSNVQSNLPGWLKQRADEIILMDWSSKEAVADLPKVFEDPRVRVVRVESEKTFIRTLAQNLATRLSRFDKVFKCDSDIIFSDDFFYLHPLEHGTFWVGHWRQARDWNERSLTGNVFFHLNDFYRINGYDERIETYGGDDTNFDNRLMLAGLKRKIFNYDCIKHVPHQTRTEGAGLQLPVLQLKLNQIRSTRRPLWSPKYKFCKFELIRNSGRILTFERKDKVEYEEVLTESDITRCVESVFSWHHSQTLQATLTQEQKLEFIANSALYWGNNLTGTGKLFSLDCDK